MAGRPWRSPAVSPSDSPPLLLLDHVQEMVTPLLHEKFYGERLDNHTRARMVAETVMILQHLAHTGYMLSVPMSPLPVSLLDLHVNVFFRETGEVNVELIWKPKVSTDYLHVDIKVHRPEENDFD